MSYKKNLLKQLAEDTQYQEIVGKVSDEEKKVIEASVASFIENFSDGLIEALEEVSKSPEATEAFLKELKKMKAPPT